MMIRPWMNNKVVERYGRLVDSGMKRVLEFGGGYSTQWLCNKGATVLCYEHDEHWANEIRKTTTAQVVHRSSYHEEIASIDGEFDIIVIDGTHRGLCVEQVLSNLHILADGGCVIFDDSERRYWVEEYAIAANRLEEVLDCESISDFDYTDAEGYFKLKDVAKVPPMNLKQSMLCFKR